MLIYFINQSKSWGLSGEQFIFLAGRENIFPPPSLGRRHFRRSLRLPRMAAAAYCSLLGGGNQTGELLVRHEGEFDWGQSRAKPRRSERRESRWAIVIRTDVLASQGGEEEGAAWTRQDPGAGPDGL